MAATPLETQQHNERIRTGISVFSNGGLALFGAFSAVLYNGAGSDGALAMAFIGLVLISTSVGLSKWLREEE